MALSGHRDMRRDGAARALSPQRLAQVQAQWDNLPSFRRDPAPDAKISQFNKQARAPEIVAMFDVLRTQLAQTFATRRVRTLAITAPTGGCGTSFVTAGLLASFARRNEQRVMGLDLNVGSPALHRFFELDTPGPMDRLISGAASPNEHLVKITNRVAVGLGAANDTPELLTQTISAQELAEMLDELTLEFAPELMICDLPPLLEGDAAMAILPQMGATLLVADSTNTTAAEITQCERLLAEKSDFLGVILNQNTGTTRGFGRHG
jgi:Mrp family chromosome partitioning ATPase